MVIVRNVLQRDRSVVLKSTGASSALLVLLGLGSIRADWPRLAQFYAGLDLGDVLMPDYLARDSLAAAENSLQDFLAAVEIDNYATVRIMAYIAGGWVLNRYLQRSNHRLQKVSAILYDRSPLQERAPQIAAMRFPRMARLIFGELILDLARTPYPTLPLAQTQIGLLIENKPTGVVRRLRRPIERHFQISWQVADLAQPHHDHIFVAINHDEMYFDLNRVRPQISHFFTHGKFSATAQRTPITETPFLHKWE